MTRRSPKNIAASVRQRLLDKARESDRPFNELLQYFAMERFLYRLSKSPYVDSFVLKGALMLTVWEAPLTRPTLDIDLLGRIDNRIETIVRVTRELCLQEVEPDGIAFDTATIEAPSPKPMNYPGLLDLPAPQLRGYSRESTIAEKFEAMVKLGVLNSRMKDFFDIWLMSRQFDYNGATLSKAILKTFSTRGTKIPAEPLALMDAFAKDTTKAAQWRGFLRKNRLSEAPKDLTEVIMSIGAFLKPISERLAAGHVFKLIWKAPGPWRE